MVLATWWSGTTFFGLLSVGRFNRPRNRFVGGLFGLISESLKYRDRLRCCRDQTGGVFSPAFEYRLDRFDRVASYAFGLLEQLHRACVHPGDTLPDLGQDGLEILQLRRVRRMQHSYCRSTLIVKLRTFIDPVHLRAFATSLGQNHGCTPKVCRRIFDI